MPLSLAHSCAAQQTDAILPSERKFKGTLDCARQIYRSAGAGGFFRGLTPTLVRAPFSNSATFLAVECESVPFGEAARERGRETDDD